MIIIGVELAKAALRKAGHDPDEAVRKVLCSFQVRTLHKILDDIDVSKTGMSRSKCKKACQCSTRFYRAVDKDAANAEFEKIIDHMQAVLSLPDIVSYIIWQGNVDHYVKIEGARE